MKTRVITPLLLLFISALLSAQGNLVQTEIGDLKTENGGVIENCIVGYRTAGNLNSDSSNVIIFPTWFGGTSESIYNIITKSGFADTAKYYFVILDALANGNSSSPSNYDGEFPEISTTDMVRSQYLLLTEKLGFDSVYGAIGGSMGGMQVLEWASLYPGYVQKIFAYVPSPRLSSFDRIFWESQLEIIEKGREEGLSEFSIRRLINIIATMNIRTPEYMNETVDDFDTYYDNISGKPSVTFSNSNFAAQIKAMLNHNIYKHHNNSIEETVKIITADLFILASSRDLTVNPGPVEKLAEAGNYKIVLYDNNCGHLAPGCEMERTKILITGFFEK